MLKCAPYIKSLCSSLHSGWWRDGTSSLPGSPIRHRVTLPSPTRSENAAGFASIESELSKDDISKSTGDECINYTSLNVGTPISENLSKCDSATGSNLELTQITPQGAHQNDLSDVKINSILSPQPSSTNSGANTSTAVVSISGNGDIVTSVIVNQPHSSFQNKPSPCGSRPEINTGYSVKSVLIHVFKKIRPESPDVTRAAKKLEMARRLGAISKTPKQQQNNLKDFNTPPNSPSRR